MMRWNSTKTYTEEDILRMQQEAVNRVHEFQTRARSIPFYDVPESAITPYPGPAPWVGDSAGATDSPTMAEDFPVDQSAFDENPYTTQDFSSSYAAPGDSSPILEGEARDITPPLPQELHTPQQSSNPLSTILSGLNIDHETLLILGLMFLLYNEKADHFLLMALAYLLL